MTPGSSTSIFGESMEEFVGGELDDGLDDENEEEQDENEDKEG